MTMLVDPKGNLPVARLSIVIPYTGLMEQLEETLLSVLENQPEDSEILVVLSEVYEDPHDIKDLVTFVYAPSGTDPVRCMNLGIDASSGSLVQTLWPGMLVEEGWADAVIGHFDDPELMAVAPLLVEQDQPDSIVAVGVEFSKSGMARLRLNGQSVDSISDEPFDVLGPLPQAAFYRKSILFELGRFDTGLSLTAAGVHLALAIEFLGGRCMVEPKSRVISSAEMLNSASVIQEARDFEHLFWRWVPRSGLMSSPIGHLGQVAIEGFSRLPRVSAIGGWLGHLFGLSSIGSHMKLYRQLALLKQRREKGYAEAPHFLSTQARRSKTRSQRVIRKAG
jgi:hypothetical protein